MIPRFQVITERPIDIGGIPPQLDDIQVHKKNHLLIILNLTFKILLFNMTKIIT